MTVAAHATLRLSFVSAAVIVIAIVVVIIVAAELVIEVVCRQWQ